MKKTTLALLATAALTMSSVYAQDRGHGGGNGGDDLELDLKKRTLQIAYFVKSSVGSKVFDMLNAEKVIDTVNTMDLDVVEGNVTDKYGTLRTCVNEPERALITCNVKRILELKKNKQEDILTGLLFHEILGIMGLELGHQENVSQYPVSSKIIPYNDIVMQTPISEASIRPEYFGLDSRSYGYTIVNKETNESLRMICLNDNVEINRCRNYAVVRNANGLQSPLLSSVVSLSPAQLSKIQLNEIKSQDLKDAEARLTRINERGFQILSLAWRNDCGNYAYGLGIGQRTGNSMMGGGYGGTGCGDELAALLPPIIVVYALDTLVEVPKTAINLATWPIKIVVNGIRAIGTKSKIKKLNKDINVVREVLNLNNDLSLVGKTKSVSDENYQRIVGMTQAALLTTQK